jgi:hypothetical protein
MRRVARAAFWPGKGESMRFVQSHFLFCLYLRQGKRFVSRGWLVAALGVVTVAATGCDQLGIETPEKVAERQILDGKAVGSACRHAMRAIEDCYTLNPKSEKASVFSGWREMDEYMRENKLDGVAPVVPRPASPAAKASAAKAAASKADDEEDDEPAQASSAVKSSNKSR